MAFKPETNNELKEAINIWCHDKEKALEQYGEINTWNTINITSMKNLFIGKINFNDDISNWDTSNVKYMAYMFSECKKFKKLIFFFIIIIIFN